MPVATLIFSGLNWLWFAAVATGGAMALLIWSYGRARGGLVRWICLLLKSLGIAALALCLLEPIWSGERARPGANLIAVVADNSQGLQIKDRGETRSRGDGLRDLLNPERAAWLGTLENNFELRRFFFDGRLQTTRDFEELVFDGRSTAIGSALRSLGERFRGRPLAGIFLLTDGNATDLREAPDLTGLPPIYPVVIGRSESPKDLSIQEARVSQSDFEDAPVSIQADVSAAGYAGDSVVAQLLDGSGKKVAEATLRARKAEDTLPFRFQLRPEKQGLSFYRLRVRAKAELEATNIAQTAEATLANNSRVLVVNRGHGPYRILYVSGRPNWDFKFLNRALQEDDQLQLTALIRVAKREPKFNFLGRAGESSNPLFRGFGNQSSEEIERYDQPVMIRLNARDEIELRGGFPRTAEDLYAFHAVILGDLEAEFFSPDQAALLQRFVSERGGGLLMLGGMESFQLGKYAHTPIGEMLPVYLDHVDDPAPEGGVKLNLTKEGWLQPWARLRDNEADEKVRLEGMAPFLVLNRVHEAKPGASVIATVADVAGKSYPALVVQRFGRGRTAALTIGDFWHWGLHDKDAHADMDKAWRQLTRWLVTDVPNRVELAIEPPATGASDAVNLQVRARDPKFQALDDGHVTVQIKPVMSEAESAGSTNYLNLQAEPSASEAGLYEAVYVPRATGGYQATSFVTNAAGLEVGRAEAGWSTDLAAEEFRSLTPNLGLLAAIARRTGGEIVPANRLEEFARQLPHRTAPIMESWTTPLWHTPAVFGFALLCLVSEWGLRRWKGMA